MKGRRSSRSAAVVLAGCVGLAVMAPGLALAAPVAGATTEADCEALGYTWADGVCDDGVTAQPDATLDGTGTGPTSTETNDESDGSDDSTGGGSTAVLPETPETPALPNDVDSEQAQQQNSGQPQEQESEQPQQHDSGGPQENNSEQPPAATTEQEAPATEDVEDALPDLQEQIAIVLPGTGALPLPDLPDLIPQPVDGKFTNVNDACLNAISQLRFPEGTEGLDVLSTQLQGFCAGLGTTDVDVCLDHLRELLKHLCPTVIEHHTTINIVNTHVSNEWWGAYWHHRYDVDCDELTYDEANAILDWDRSDPFRLDRDDDGEACEANAHGDDVETVVYDSYPVGGVATGDGSTDSGASGVEVALAAGALGGLGVTGLALVRRFARQG